MSASVTATHLLLANVSPTARPRVNGAEINTLPFREQDSKVTRQGCGCTILLQGGSADPGLIHLLHAQRHRLAPLQGPAGQEDGGSNAADGRPSQLGQNTHAQSYTEDEAAAGKALGRGEQIARLGPQTSRRTTELSGPGTRGQRRASELQSAAPLATQEPS